jgi:hypothetical protein
MGERVDHERDERQGERSPCGRDPAPAVPAACEHESGREQWRQQAPGRVDVRQGAERNTDGHAAREVPAPGAAGTIDRQQQQAEHQRLHRHLERHSTELE